MIEWTNCDFWGNQLAARHPNDLLPAEQVALQQHINECPGCAAACAIFHAMEERIRILPQSEPLPSFLHQLQHTPQEEEPESSGDHPLQLGDSPDTQQNNELLPTQRPTFHCNIHLIAIRLRCLDSYAEIIVGEPDTIECLVESLISVILIDHFDTVKMEEVAVRFMYDADEEQCVWKLGVTALGTTSSSEHSLDMLELVLEDRICCLLVELFGLVIADTIEITEKDDDVLMTWLKKSY